MQRKTYHFATSKSDDILYHHEMQEKQQSLRESQIRRISFDQKINVNEQKRTSHYSITFKDESKKVSQAHVKKKLLTQIASFGYNAYMAEYLIEKQKISLEEDYTKLLDFMIDQINTQESQIKSCPKLKQSTYRQIMPVSFEEQQKLQIDQFIEEPHSEYVSEKELTCGICMCDFMDKKKALNCSHEFCMKCLQDYLDNKINCGQVLEVECPQQGCDNFFTDEIIKSLVCEEQYQKFEKFKQMRILEKDETVRWCVKPGCDKFVKGNVFSRIVKCECGQEMCYDCRREDHPGLTCDEALDKYYEQTLKQLIIQRCPKCKAPIQKKEGCNHMTCYQCRFQFCWLCRARYTRMHFDSDNCFGCPDKQFSTEDPLPRPRWKKYGGIVFEIFASTLILPLLPFILIYYSVLGPLKLLKHYRRSYYRGLDDGDKLCILFLGLMTFPLTMILLIFPGAILLLAYKLKYD